MPKLGIVAEQRDEFGVFIFHERQKRGWTLREAAKAAGISHSRLSELEAGFDTHTHKAFKPGYVQVIRLARAYDLPPEDLLALAGHRPGSELAPVEWRLVGAYRRLPSAEREELLALMEKLEAKIRAGLEPDTTESGSDGEE